MSSGRCSRPRPRKVREAGGVLAGGHTLRDEEPLYGLAVVGTVAPDADLDEGRRPARRRALPDASRSEPGFSSTRARRDAIDDATLAPTVELMKTLNARVAEILRAFEPHAVTDVTGFGLIGHAYELATRSGVRVEIDARLLPVHLRRRSSRAGLGAVTGGDARNREYVGDALDGRRRLRHPARRSRFDPQTAGGLLTSLPLEQAAAFEQACLEQDILPSRIGAVSAGAGVRLFA